MKPREHGFDTTNGHRRSRGVSQEEFAHLLGWTARHYGEFERGELANAPDSVLERIVKLAGLGDGERTALYFLASGHPPAPPPTPHDPAALEPLRGFVERLAALPAMVTDCAWNVLLWSAGVAEWFQDPLTLSPEERNVMLWLFAPAASERIVGIEQERADMLGRLRGCYVIWPGEPRLENLIARLLKIPEARAIWERGEIRDQPVVQVRTVRHPQRGQYALPSVTTDLPRGLRLIIFIPPGH
ncbi:MAG: helix-turn-helix domain-containing protein [Sciscionella sp.]